MNSVAYEMATIETCAPPRRAAISNQDVLADDGKASNAPTTTTDTHRTSTRTIGIESMVNEKKS